MPQPHIDSSSHHDLDTSDLPPLPTFKPGSPSFSRQAPYSDVDNPWNDRPSPGHDTRTDKPLPPILQAGNAWTAPPMNELPPSSRATNPDTVTRRSSSESVRSRNFWDDDDDDVQDEKDAPSSASQWQQNEHQHVVLNGENPGSTPLSSAVRRKPVAQPASSSIEQPGHPPPPPPGHTFHSKNPFRRDASSERTPESVQQSEVLSWESESSSSKGKGKQVPRDQTTGGLYSNPHQEDLLLLDQAEEAYHSEQQSQPPNYESGEQAWSQELRTSSHLQNAPPQHPTAPPPPVPTPLSPFTAQPPLIPVSSEQRQGENPWLSQKQAPPQFSTPGASHEDLARYNDYLLDRGQETGVVSLGDELFAIPNAVEATSTSQQNLPSTNYDHRPPLPAGHEERLRESMRTHAMPRRYSGHSEEFFDPPDGPPPPLKPPRPAPSIVTTMVSDAELAKMQTQRNETYQIKHFNWFDNTSRKLRRSSMLTQNKNGPCPLLALVNALILGAREDSQAALDNALRAREQVSLGLIIETLMDELLSGGNEDALAGLPDVDELNRFLLRLHTGMNANPRFVMLEEQVPNLMDARNSVLHVPQSVNTDREMGSFEATQDIKLYSSFSVPLVHGWLPPRADPARSAFRRSAQTYEDAQALLFGEEELEYKLSQGGLTEEEQRLWQDITSIKNFLKSHPTQLTSYGLEVIQESVFPGSFAIMFRNDHFSTIYKHPESGELFTLVTDAGYSDRDEIVWESLVDVNGQNCEFYSGDFRPVGNNHVEQPGAPEPGPRRSSQHISSPIIDAPTPISPQERQEQHDADFAMALQLQEEEEQQANRARRQSNQSGRPARNASEGNIPIRLRPQDQTSIRPLIPARTARTPNPGVNRPADATGEEAPPLYEEAVKSRPYNPPVGSPLHPSSDPSPRSSTAQLSGVVSVEDPPPSITATSSHQQQQQPRRQQPRRMSAYGEMSHSLGGPGGYPQGQGRGRPGVYGQAPGQYGMRGGRSGPTGTGSGERECVVM